MFSREERCIYQNNPLADVICQLRFPEILTIETTLPAAFQDAIRDEYPQYSLKKEVQTPKLIGTPGNMQLEQQNTTNNYQFASADGFWRINLTSRFISLTCSRYIRWEDFARKLDKPLTAFIKQYQPAYFERIGLRYLNFISRQDLQLTDVPFFSLIQPSYLGLLADPEVPEQTTTRNSVDAELAVGSNCRVKIHAGPGMTHRNGKVDRELKFIFDQDVFTQDKIPIYHSASILETLHTKAYAIFRGAITDTLHDAMNPDE